MENYKEHTGNNNNNHETKNEWEKKPNITETKITDSSHWNILAQDRWMTG